MTDAVVVLAMGASAAGLAVLVASLVTEQRPRQGFGILLALLVFLIGAVGVALLRGGPKLASTELARPEVAEVLWLEPRRDTALVLLRWPGLKEPQYYEVAWTAERQRDFTTASQEAATRHSLVVWRHPFGGKGGHGIGVPGGPDAGAPGGAAESETGDNLGMEGAFYAAPPPPVEVKP